MPSMDKVWVSFGLVKSIARAMKRHYCNVPMQCLLTCLAITVMMLAYCAQVKCQSDIFPPSPTHPHPQSL